MKKNINRGFSLIELLVVITIIAILMSVGIVSYRQAGINARNGKRKTDLESVRQALVLYRADNAQYPSAASFDDLLDSLRVGGYLGNDGVVDPKDEPPFTYSYSSDGRIFTLNACLEPNSASTCAATQVYEVSNP